MMNIKEMIDWENKRNEILNFIQDTIVLNNNEYVSEFHFDFDNNSLNVCIEEISWDGFEQRIESIRIEELIKYNQ